MLTGYRKHLAVILCALYVTHNAVGVREQCVGDDLSCLALTGRDNVTA